MNLGSWLLELCKLLLLKNGAVFYLSRQLLWFLFFRLKVVSAVLVSEANIAHFKVFLELLKLIGGLPSVFVHHVIALLLVLILEHHDVFKELGVVELLVQPGLARDGRTFGHLVGLDYVLEEPALLGVRLVLGQVEVLGESLLAYGEALLQQVRTVADKVLQRGHFPAPYADAVPALLASVGPEGHIPQFLSQAARLQNRAVEILQKGVRGVHVGWLPQSHLQDHLALFLLLSLPGGLAHLPGLLACLQLQLVVNVAALFLAVFVFAGRFKVLCLVLRVFIVFLLIFLVCRREALLILQLPAEFCVAIQVIPNMLLL